MKRLLLATIIFVLALPLQSLCDDISQEILQEAENYLLKAYELDLQTSGPEFMSLTELARLKYDQKQYGKAVGFYERAIRAMEKAGASEKAPIGFADILDEYGNALQHTGQTKESRNIRSKASKLRRLNPGGHSVTDRTPYGT